MITTLLLDLDDTLLETDFDTFLPAYLKSVADHLSAFAPADRIIALLMDGTKAMLENRDPTRTLREVFASIFYPAIERSEDDLQTPLEAFYRQVYPQLKATTRPKPEAPALVAEARRAGLELALATSPLFPRTAIEQRLAWAGVAPEGNAFTLITSYEQFHFSKPDAAYYAEILGRLGRSPEQAAMIGDDLENDLAPARAIGMAAFHVSPKPAPGYSGGSLSEVMAWVAERAADDVEPEASHLPQALLAHLRGQLAAFLGQIEGMDEAAWRARPGPDSWAAVEIACHLRDVELEVNLPRVEAILTAAKPFLQAKDTDPWAEQRGYLAQSPGEAVASFTEARLRFIERLAPLGPDDWARPALHALFGPTSLAEVVAFAVEHERSHLAQLRAALQQARLQNPSG